MRCGDGEGVERQARQAWPDLTAAAQGVAAKIDEEEEQWPANPWQAEADAHIAQLQQQQMQGSIAWTHTHPVPPPLAAAAAALPQLQWQASRPAIERVHELEGQVVALEDVATRREKELEEARAQLRAQELRLKELLQQSALGRQEDLADLKRRNEFLTTVVARYEEKTMHQSQELASLTRKLRLSDERAGKAEESAKSLQRELQAREQIDVSTQTAQSGETKDVIMNLEGQVASLEEVLFSRDHELAALKQREVAFEDEKSRGQKSADQEALEKMAALQQERNFLRQLADRYETKVMEQAQQLETAMRGEATLRQKAEAEQACHMKEILDMKTQLSELKAELEDERAGAAGMQLTLRDVKRDHHRRMQELLKKAQLLEKQNKDLANDKARSDAALEDATAVASSLRLTETGQKGELQAMKELNASLVARLTQERSERADDIKRYEASIQENETLCYRLERLAEQLYESVEVNDALEARLAQMSDGSKAPPGGEG
mmetsp:Transcript_25746/g.60100  ORF Transcript_25746/g.60100 Transcript_25746/m.60100 type:complete len:495 (-) Transcript_25746:543-2027(-)